MNYSAKLDIAKINGAFTCKIQGKQSAKNCLCIPLDADGVFVGQKGIYVSISAIEMKEQKYDDTHIVRQSFSKDEYERMTDEQKQAIPILGGMKPFITKKSSVEPQETAFTVQSTENDDLPF